MPGARRPGISTAFAKGPQLLPRERVVIAAPTACSCCGSDRIVKMGEDVTETLEVIPRQWKVIQTVREKFTCRSCEKISQPPAPFHPTPRGWAGPNLLAMILFEKFGQHQPLNRQAERYAKEGVEISLSTLADQVGACAAALEPIHAVIRAHVLDAERLHGDDTTVPLLAKGGTRTARLWTYVRDDRPFGGGAPPAALFHFSRDRAMANPNRHLAGWKGLLQADAYGGYNDLYRADRNPGPVRSTLCWSHARRKFFELADIEGNARKGKYVHDISPVALEAVARIDAIFDIERGINGLAAVERQEQAPAVPTAGGGAGLVPCLASAVRPTGEAPDATLHLPAGGSELLAGTAPSPASSGDGVCCRQAGYLVSEALSAFARIPPPANGVAVCGSEKPVLAAGPVGSKPLWFGAVARYLARIFRHRLRALRGAGSRGVGVRPSAS